MNLPVSVNTINFVRISITFLLVALVGGLVALACNGAETTEPPAPTQAPAATAEPTPLATASPAPEATATAEPTPPATAEPSVEPTVEATPIPTTVPTLEPTATPLPDPTPMPADAEPEPELTLELLEPGELEVITEESRIELVGSTRVDAIVTINDTVVEPDGDGFFSLGVDLEEGPNIIEIVASVASGVQKDLVLVVIYIP